MYTVEDLLKRLQAGEAHDAIATEMTDTLNKEIEEYARNLASQHADMLNAAMAQQEEAQLKQEAKHAEKVRYANEIAENLDLFIHEFYPIIEKPHGKLLTGKDLVELLDMIEEFSTTFMTAFQEAQESKAKKRPVTEDALKKFLKEMNLV